MKPMLAKEGNERILESEDYLFEPKLDGHRIIAQIDKGKTRLYSRNGHDVTGSFEDFGLIMDSEDAIIDGEMIAYDNKGKTDFSKVKDGKNLIFAVFDIINKDGKDLKGEPLEERKKVLEETLSTSDHVQVVPYFPDGKKLFDEMEKREEEGIIAKKKGSRYIQGRSSNWLKIKIFKTIDCIILKINEKRSVTVGLYEKGKLIDVGIIGTGFTEKSFKTLKEGDVIEAKYSQITKNKKIRAGVFLRKRDDKRKEECTLDQTGLENYGSKRDFKKTPEPGPNDGLSGSKENPLYVIQRHDASRLHYDFRLEDSGVLRSWAVPKGVSTNPSDKRLAVMVEDHPMDYANFEGVIPEGNYGAGTVSIWDKGRFVNITIKKGKVMPLSEAIEKGHFLIWVKGDKLKGGFAFTRVNDKKNEWLLVKMRDEKKEYRQSARIDGNDLAFTNTEKELYAGLAKGDFIEYHIEIASLMLPHIKGRLLSLYRFPEGVGQKGFYQKNIEGFPDWISTKELGGTKYMHCENEACIVYLANLMTTPHIWTSTVDDLEHPDKMIFDLDPSKKNLDILKQACIDLKSFLESIGLVPFIMTTGGKGYHIICPIKPELTHKEVRAFAGRIAETLADADPKHLTTEHRIEKRKDRIFIDVNRNNHKQTSVAPYAVRDHPGLPIAKPIGWDELGTSDPQTYTILDANRIAKEKDPWKDLDKKRKSLKEVIGRLKK